MSTFKIGVTGVGGGVGQSILKSLADTEYEIISLDGELLAAGLYVTPKSYLIPYESSPNYIECLLEICKREKISLLFPGLDAELMVLSLNKKLFEDIGTIVIVSRPEVITISDNKLETYSKLIAAGVNVPFTTSADLYSFNDTDLPLILKQKIGGARSKNVYIIRSLDEWKSITNTIQNELANFIVMEYIEGDEYTCGTINLENTCRGVIVMRRILRDGDTHKCFTEKNDIIENEVRLVVDTIKPFGACNIQLRLKNGKAYVFEINARCSGTTAARTLSGFNEPKMIADYILKGIEPNFEIKEQTILRYWSELVVDNSTIEKFRLNQKNTLIKSINL